MASTSTPEPTGTARKRVLSTGNDSITESHRKRPRVSAISSISAEFQTQLRSGSPSVTSGVSGVLFIRRVPDHDMLGI